MSVSFRKTLWIILLHAFSLTTHVRCNPITETDLQANNIEFIQTMVESVDFSNTNGNLTVESTISNENSNDSANIEQETLKKTKPDTFVSFGESINITEQLPLKFTVKPDIWQDEINSTDLENTTSTNEDVGQETSEEYEELLPTMSIKHEETDENTTVSIELTSEDETSDLIQRQKDAKSIVELLGRLLNKLEVPPLEWNNYRYITALKGPDGSIYVPQHHRQSTRKHLATLLGFAEEIVTSKNALAQMDSADNNVKAHTTTAKTTTTTTTTTAEPNPTEIVEESVTELISEAEIVNLQENETVIDGTENYINVNDTTEEGLNAFTDAADNNTSESVIREPNEVSEKIVTPTTINETEETNKQSEITELETTDTDNNTTYVFKPEEGDYEESQDLPGQSEEYEEI